MNVLTIIPARYEICTEFTPFCEAPRASPNRHRENWDRFAPNISANGGNPSSCTDEDTGIQMEQLAEALRPVL